MIDESPRPGRTASVRIATFEGAEQHQRNDEVATEEPLELRLVAGNRTQTLAVTMRTPGHDFELAAGFVLNERILRDPRAIAQISYCIDPAVDAEQRYNIVNVRIDADALPDMTRFERHFAMTSACGVCGRANLDELRDLGVEPLSDKLRIQIERLYELPERMRAAQRIFASTGGLHAAALFDERGELQAVREDIGRHNALDKLVGWGSMTNRLPFSDTILCVSGRAGYEILQKAAVAGIPIVCAVSAPSSLAVELACEFNITLVGFLRGTRANIYSASERIIPS